MAVTFQAEGHIYRNDEGVRYTSVTTLIGMYKAPFDGEYWSTYKAVKVVLESKGTWSRFKQRAGGWENVVRYYNSLSEFPWRAEVTKVKLQFLASWENSGRIAREAGSAYHNMMEETSIQRGTENKNGKAIKVCSPADLLALQEFKDDGVYTELLLYNDHFRLAGMADKVIKEGRTVHIHDYKTSKEIEMEAFQDQTMKIPLKHIPSCNYYEYTIQLSLYAWMLEIAGYRVGDLVIEHVPAGHKEYRVKYLRDEVQNLLSHYGKSKSYPAFKFPKERETGITFSPSESTEDGEIDFRIVA